MAMLPESAFLKMSSTISASALNLHDLTEHFRLRPSGKTDFFAEWCTDLPELSASV
ncbi:MAG: hypothetical protein HC910_13280 [Spirulinaceae cyanobacterium SM2_1_0]|nr:hypothetical protein [Spirulinaceae cyanobacterium SM2_1_0]